METEIQLLIEDNVTSGRGYNRSRKISRILKVIGFRKNLENYFEVDHCLDSLKEVSNPSSYRKISLPDDLKYKF